MVVVVVLVKRVVVVAVHVVVVSDVDTVVVEAATVTSSSCAMMHPKVLTRHCEATITSKRTTTPTIGANKSFLLCLSSMYHVHTYVSRASLVR